MTMVALVAGAHASATAVLDPVALWIGRFTLACTVLLAVLVVPELLTRRVVSAPLPVRCACGGELDPLVFHDPAPDGSDVCADCCPTCQQVPA